MNIKFELIDENYDGQIEKIPDRIPTYYMNMNALKKSSFFAF